MEEITKEEQLEQLKLEGITDEDFQRVSGGNVRQCVECMENCRKNLRGRKA